jgi:pimeloyl-ACP methyl ester carboxylesterase
MRFSRIATNGIHLHVAEDGPPEGPLVVLLHGFPEFWYSWRNQFTDLADRGFHVLAPDLRGYNLSDKPRGIASYDLDQLAADVVGLASHFGQERFAVVGHDWGAAIGWWLAGRYPDRLRQLAVLNAAHPAVWLHAIRTDPEQKRASANVRFFQVPLLPELLIGLNRDGALGKGFRDSTRTDAFAPADLNAYRVAWRQPGVLTATINYYRAALRKPLRSPEDYRITCPTLIIWGRRDIYSKPELAEASVRLCTQGRIVYLDNASHWVQHDEPEQVSKLLLDFLCLD